MRVIGGEFRSRTLKSLPDRNVRPTPDRLRETLFNILSPYIKKSVFVDAYAGTGAVGIEAISRGARRVIFIEHAPAAVAIIKQNLESLAARSRSEVWAAPASRRLKDHEADIVFIDPPYPLESEYALAMKLLAKNPPRVLLVVQHSSRFQLDEQYGELVRTRQVRQGENTLSFYRRPQPELQRSAEADTEELGGASLVDGDFEKPGTS
jgi:16S rRNA (guanine(966)-N(2))-methyltransferase RsmD